MDHLTVDLWADNLSTAPADLAGWLAQLEARMADAAANGVSLLVLPEFTCARWLAFAPADLAPHLVLKWLADTGVIALAEMIEQSARHGVALIPGTIPHETVAEDGTAGFYNRAWFITPDRACRFQDKLSLTPHEAIGPEGRTIHGENVQVMTWNGLRVAIAICLDSEYTALWAILGTLDLDLVIVPAKTDMITGFNRVFGCARARAIELQTAVCVVGAVGAPLTSPAVDTGTGGAAVYLPCDVSVSLDGLFALLPARVSATAGDSLLRAVAVPVGLCRSLRHGSAEAEQRPAAWSAGHLSVVET